MEQGLCGQEVSWDYGACGNACSMHSSIGRSWGIGGNYESNGKSVLSIMGDGEKLTREKRS